MRKIIIGAIILFFVTLLVACSQTPSDTSFRLHVPHNIEVEKNILRFDKVAGAKAYILSINGVNTEITETTYTFKEDGTYRVRIQALSGNEDFVSSLFSDAIEFKVRFLQYPDDIDIVNNQVEFTEDTDAESYDVEINGVVYNSKEDLPPYLEPGTYDIRIKANSEQYNASDFSPITTVTVDKSDRLYTKHNYQYSVYSSKYLPVYIYKQSGALKYIEIQETKVEKDEVIEVQKLTERIDYYGSSHASRDAIYFNISYMNHLKDLFEAETGKKTKTFTFIVHTNLGDHEISLEMNRLETPYSYSGQNATTNFQDAVVFGFETFDYTFKAVKGYEITDEDYVFEADKLTLYIDFLQIAYNKKRSVPHLEFVVIFELDDKLYEYPIYISK